jgi:uncharacterized protein
MIYNVAGLLTGNLGDSQQYEIENERLEISGYKLTKISGPVRLMRTDVTVLVSAEIEAKSQGLCSRCLEPASLDIFVAMEEEFTPINANLMDSAANQNEIGDAFYDPALIIDERNFLDLTVGLGQALLSAIPIAPLCKDDCLGICPTCTVNRNIIQCSCAKSSVDPRWAGLAGLLGKGAESAD